MERNLESRRNLRDKQCGTAKNTMLPQTSNRVNPRGSFRQEKPHLSYADLHLEITKNVNDVSPRSTWNHQKQHYGLKTADDDELVKYMSKVPGYLERGKKQPQEKVLNVGVLEWGRLEKWQHGHKEVSHRSSVSSLSNSNTSSSFFTDESSPHTSRGHSCSPSCQRARRPSLQFHLMSSPKEGDFHDVKPLRDSARNPLDSKAAQGNSLNVQGKCIGGYKSSTRNNPEIELEQFKVEDLRTKIKAESGTTNGVKFKVNIVRQDGKPMIDERFQEGNLDDLEQRFLRRGKAGVLLPTKLFPKMDHSGPYELSDPAANPGQQKAAPSGRIFTEELNAALHAELNSALPHSCPHPLGVDDSNLSQIKPIGLADAITHELSYERSRSVLSSASTGCSFPKSRNLEGNVASIKPAVQERLKGSHQKVSKVASEKVRSTSPFRRLSFSVMKMSKSSSSKDSSAIPQSSSASAKYDSETPATSRYASAYGDKTNPTSKGRSSPLRRLLDPLLKPKVVNCSDVAESVQRRSISTERASRSSHGQGHPSTARVSFGKVKLDPTRCSTAKVDGFSKGIKDGSPVIQALFRVQVKNGLPLFTFAVNNESDILAATMKMFSASSKDDHSCIFKFFSIKEVRKKNGRWLNQGGKGKGQDYVPNVVAQMRVSSSNISHSPRQNSIDQFRVREFVLSGVNIGQENQQAPDIQQNEELAAIVVKIPRRNAKSSSGYESQTDKHNEPLKDGLNDRQDIGTSVILPSGAHSLPCKGGPSSLVQRWTSGGSCDCGGWDLGCQLKVLSNGNPLSKRSASIKSSSDNDRLELFFEGGLLQENKPFFKMSHFKDSIYSVDFNSSLSLMQAFSICVAVWDSRRLCEPSNSTNLLEERTSVDTVSLQNDGTKAPNPTEGEAPARYASYPPLSPVGRV